MTYLFVSVSTLELEYSKNAFGGAAAAIVTNLEMAWWTSWFPLVAPASTLGNIQLGYGLGVVVLASLAGLHRGGLPAKFFAAVTVVFLFLLTPTAERVEPRQRALASTV